MSNSGSAARLMRALYQRCAPLKYNDVALAGNLFAAALHRERRRAERSGAVLIVGSVRLVDFHEKRDVGILQSMEQTLLANVRETDIVGWTEERAVIGILFTEVRSPLLDDCCATLENRMKAAILNEFGVAIAHRVRISIAQPLDGGRDPANPRPETYPFRRGAASAFKRALDIAVSLLALVVCSPALLVVVVCIKLTSPGPVIYKQDRVGKDGRIFTFLKFRSMFHNNSSSLHEDFVSQYIENSSNRGGRDPSRPVYKIIDDPRITPIGRFLRRSSLDEFPQFINVLRGEMSLVGPRPPLPYEFERYKPWHRRRVLESIPGITGLWQVQGRSRLSFDDAVRLDLNYIKNWSIWLDVQILLKTPAAVLSGNGAY